MVTSGSVRSYKTLTVVRQLVGAGIDAERIVSEI
jgi:hypothetical protein